MSHAKQKFNKSSTSVCAARYIRQIIFNQIRNYSSVSIFQLVPQHSLQMPELSLRQLKEFLSSQFQDLKDYAVNGLQVQGTNSLDSPVRKIIFSVSQSMDLFKKAAEEKADVIFVHHGFFINGQFSVTGVLAQKIKLLMENGISLFAYHLPLDAHPVLGHNAELAKAADLQILEPLECGFICTNNNNHSIADISAAIGGFLDTNLVFRREFSVTSQNGAETRLLPTATDGNLVFHFGAGLNYKPKLVYVCSGGSGSFIHQTIAKNCDLFILGEVSEHHVTEASENSICLMSLGHWRSEQPGIWAVQRLLQEQFSVECKFVGIQNSI